MTAASSEERHRLTLACERLQGLLEEVQNTRFALDDLDVPDMDRALRNAQMFVESASQAAEKALLSGRTAREEGQS